MCTVASPAMAHVPPPPLDFQPNNCIFSSLGSKFESQILCSLWDQLVQISTAHSSFNQYYISHITISHRAAAAQGPEVRHECPMTCFPVLPLLATNSSDATGCAHTNFFHQGFRKLSSDRRMESSEIINHCTLQVISKRKPFVQRSVISFIRFVAGVWCCNWRLVRACDWHDGSAVDSFDDVSCGYTKWVWQGLWLRQQLSWIWNK